MRRLREKWNSQSGASILLALLFFLVCVMVAASVLAAAASNAGKIRSNYDEQQKYMALSSALRLVAGELEQAKYTGKYTVTKWTETIVIGTDADGNEITQTQEYFHVKQTAGEFKCGLEKTLSFQNEMDQWFSQEFNRTGFEPLEIPPDSLEYERTVKVTVENVGDQFEPIIVKVKLDEGTRRFSLEAVLREPSNPDIKQYSMKAELTADGFPVVSFDPGMALPKDTEGPGAADPSYSYEAAPKVEWKLDWIIKGQREEEGG